MFMMCSVKQKDNRTFPETKKIKKTYQNPVYESGVTDLKISLLTLTVTF